MALTAGRCTYSRVWPIGAHSCDNAVWCSSSLYRLAF